MGQAYYLDFEFLEGDVPVKIFGINIPKWLVKPNNTIQPISIGLVSSDGREYYAVSKDFNLKEAWNRYDEKDKAYPWGNPDEKEKVYWIRENVLKSIWNELLSFHLSHPNLHPHFGHSVVKRKWFEFSYKDLKWLIDKYGKTNKQIAEEVKEFCYNYTPKSFEESIKIKYQNKRDIQFYGYYSAYDHVALSWLFGNMIDLPAGFPKYTIDLKQMLDEKADSLTSIELSRLSYPNCKHNVFELLGNPKFNLTNLGCLKSHKNYPKQTNSHHALDDARWNKKLHEFLVNL